MGSKAPARWADLITDALTKPGTFARCYRTFHHYSLGNTLLAWFQCAARGIEPGPMATLPRWNQLGRRVISKERQVQMGMRLDGTTCPLTLCQPYTAKKEKDDGTVDVWTGFTYRAKWYVLAQTEGADYSEPDPVGGWDRVRALQGLDVEQVKFTHPDGNCQGYASKRTIAVSPLAAHPERTIWHELAHVVLGHTKQGPTIVDGKELDRSLREVEAETTAYILGEVLMPDDTRGASDSRGYIQGWLAENKLPEKTAGRIMGAAQKILEAGQTEATKAPKAPTGSADRSAGQPVPKGSSRGIGAGEMRQWRKALA